MDKTLSTEDVSRKCGITIRQLQWWDERGILDPVKIGHSRRYSKYNVMKAKIIIGLRRKGFTLAQIRGIPGLFIPDRWESVLMPMEREKVWYFATDGKHYKAHADAEQIAYFCARDGVGRAAVVMVKI